MTCRGCGHAYPVSNGIPNMVSHHVWYNKEKKPKKKKKKKGTDKFVLTSCSLSTRLADELPCKLCTLDSYVVQYPMMHCRDKNRFHSIYVRTLHHYHHHHHHHHRRTGHTHRKRKRHNSLGHLDYYSAEVPEEVDYKDNFEEAHRVRGA